VADGRAQALVCNGSTGTALVAGQLHIRRARGVHRPALALTLPIPGRPVTLLDVGANADVRPEVLVQFAFMGAAYASAVLGIERPRVGLLSNGSEAQRGSQLVLDTHARLVAQCAGSAALVFVGNVEGSGLTQGVADVVVTDGFTGNVVLKVAEGIGDFLFSSIAREARKSVGGKVGGALLRPKLRPLRDRVDYRKTGGALLLGVAGEVVIAHGRSDAEATMNAIRVAARAADQGVSGVIAGAVRTPVEVGAQ